MAAYASLISLTTIMDQVQNHHRLSKSLDMNQIESLREKLHFLLNFTEIDSHLVLSKEGVVMESLIASAANAAEDLIESHVADQIHAGPVSLLGLQMVIQDMDSIKQKVLQFKEGSRSKDVQPIPSTSSRPLTTNKNTMLGFGGQLIQLMEKLTAQPSNHQIIAITGMGGIGKTTLANNAYQHLLIVRHFDFRAWVTVSQKYNVREILLQLLSMQSSSETDEKLGEYLHKRLWGRRYLIVVDDIWSIEAWDKVKLFLPNNNNGSRIAVTTRLSNLATHFDSLRIEMAFLDEETGWKLFCEKAFGDQEGCPLELECIAKGIAKNCKGLPLSIVVIAGLLGRSCRTQELWKNIANDLISILNSGEGEDCLSILSLSYTHLPVHLKPCFLYIGVFPEDHRIGISEVIALWVAEGFIKPNKVQSLEEIAQGYLDDFIDRNLIMKHSLGSTGKIKYFKIHDLLRDLCLKLGKKHKFVCGMDIPQGMDMERLVVFNERLSKDEYHTQVFHTPPPATLAGTLISNGGRLPFDKRLLRIINVEHKDKYLEAIFNQVNLRYLAYRPDLTASRSPFELPSSISLLWNMQTLVIRWLNRLFVAPLEIWKMQQLRHLHIPMLSLPNPPPSSEQPDDLVLQKLQTLKRVVNFRWSEEVYKRIPNVKKLSIRYDNSYQGNSNRYCVYNFGRLHKLESLRCFFRPMLRDDYLLANLTLPSSLRKLSLTGCGLHWQDLTRIGSLPHLEVLKLGQDSFIGPEWNPVEGDFLHLKSLLIEFSSLVYWNADSSSFPVLENLVLEEMQELDEIPLDIGEIPTLRVISLYCCSESAAISAMRIAESDGNEELQVRVEFDYMEEVESFWEKVGQSAESFTGSNFQVRKFS